MSDEGWARSGARFGRPVPTVRVVWLALVAIIPAAFAVIVPWMTWFLVAFDVLLAALVVVDFVRATSPRAIRARRVIEPVISSGRANAVRVELELDAGFAPMRGTLRDTCAPGPELTGHHAPFAMADVTSVTWHLTPATRGDLALGEVWLRVDGPLGLCARQFSVPLNQTVKVFPDLQALTKDALALAKASTADAKRVVRVRAEGREFESLREYRPGDDKRTIDWKATAKRARPMVRVHQPERNQVVLLLLDCGRHMAGVVGGRRKLDLAVDATLRLAKVALDQGDLVGLMAFGAEVKVWLPPRKGTDHLRALTQALYRVEATLEESAYGKAIDLAFSRGVRRSLVVVLTDLLDEDSSRALVQRVRRLTPRHLPLVASMRDAGVHEVATAIPETETQAHQRRVAVQLEREVERTVSTLRDGGARVLRATPADFGPAAVSSYLDVKSRGLL